MPRKLPVDERNTTGAITQAESGFRCSLTPLNTIAGLPGMAGAWSFAAIARQWVKWRARRCNQSGLAGHAVARANAGWPRFSR